jgi:hypothetical protein
MNTLLRRAYTFNYRTVIYRISNFTSLFCLCCHVLDFTIQEQQISLSLYGPTQKYLYQPMPHNIPGCLNYAVVEAWNITVPAQQETLIVWSSSQ